MADWDPALYTRFEDERTRPAADLLGRVPLTSPALVIDLGCGPGNSTALLAARYSQAEILGVDSSAAMIAEARKRLPDLRFQEADIATWSPARAPDLIFANAVMQWIPGHDTLFPRLVATLKPGGVLAVQMPDNLDEPSHRAMRAIAAEMPFADQLAEAAGVRTPLPRMEAYYDLLSASGNVVDVWRTCYHHPMPTAGAIVTWLKATGLRPFLDPLSQDDRAAFLARFEDRIDTAYPVRSDGNRLLGFPRVFIVAFKPRS